MTEEKEKPKLKRGFASMDIEKRRAIASMGGKSVPSDKRSFSVNRHLATEAGRKGGAAADGANRTFSRDRNLAAASGANGGASRARHRSDSDNDP